MSAISANPIEPSWEQIQEWITKAREEGLQPLRYAVSKAAEHGAEMRLRSFNDWIRGIEVKPPGGVSGIRAELTPIQLDCICSEFWIACKPNRPSATRQAIEQYNQIESILKSHGHNPAGCVREALLRLREIELNA